MQASLERLRERRASGDEGGFTLIELLIVIVILGILAAIVVFAVQNLTSQSASAGCQSDYKTVETAAEAYKAQMGAYPTTIATLTKTGTDPGTGQTIGPWLKDLPSTTRYNMVINSAAVFSDTEFAGLTTDGVIYVVTSTGTTGNALDTAVPQAVANYGTTGYPKVSPAAPTMSGPVSGVYTVSSYPSTNASTACTNVTSA
jgi:type II secretion system protein G